MKSLVVFIPVMVLLFVGVVLTFGSGSFDNWPLRTAGRLCEEL